MRFLVTRKQMDERERLIRIEARQQAHEHGCAQKWELTAQAIKELREELDARSDRLEARLEEFDRQRDRQHSANVKLLLTILIGVLGFIGDQVVTRVFPALTPH